MKELGNVFGKSMNLELFSFFYSLKNVENIDSLGTIISFVAHIMIVYEPYALKDIKFTSWRFLEKFDSET